MSTKYVIVQSSETDDYEDDTTSGGWEITHAIGPFDTTEAALGFMDHMKVHPGTKRGIISLTAPDQA